MPARTRRGPIILILLVHLSASAPVVSADNRSPVDIDPAIDLPLTAGSAAVAAGPYFFRNQADGPWCGLECDPESINSLDRLVIGNNSDTARLTSDILLGSSIAAPFVLGFADVLLSDPADGWDGYGKDSLVIMETLSINLMINQCQVRRAPAEALRVRPAAG